MTTKQKKWFKSAFVEPKSPAVDVHKRQKVQDVFENDDDSINFTDLDLSNICNNNTPTAEKEKQTQEVSMVCSDFKSSNWIENFAPQSKADLAIHPTKVSEVEEWFRAIQERKIKVTAPILLVTGPSGSGKTAAIKIIANEFGYTISEWITPVDIEHTRHGQANNEGVTYSESQTDKFAQFLFQSSRYRSVFDTSSKRLVLVEDFPNVFIKDPSSFEEILERYTKYGKSPLIFIVADSKSRTLNISYNLFTDEVRCRYNIMSISFNAVADTMLKKGLKRICSIMAQPGFKSYYTEPSNEVVENIVLSSQGDIRSAVINLHFASQKDSMKLQIQPVNQSTSSTSRSKKTKAAKKGKLKSLGTDENITVLHALGRVFNPKYQDAVDSHGNRAFLHPPDDISSLLSTQPSTSLNLIHHNYISHFQSLEDTLGAIDCLSAADMLLNEWRSDLSAEMGLNLAVRGVMTSNTKPITGRWMPIRSGKNQQKSREDNYEKERREFGISGVVSSFNYARDYRTYLKIIPKTEFDIDIDTTIIE